jgi:ADP-ribose diphosphatase
MSKDKPAGGGPRVVASQWLTHSRLFHVEQLDLEFSNGARRTFERLNPGHNRSVMVVPVLGDDTLVLVREYGAGLGHYYLSFPKGAMDVDETLLETANRELKEEAGYGAHQLELLTELALSPSYMGNRMNIVLARDLYPCRLAGDEPEPIEVLQVPAADFDRVLAGGEFCESYAVAAWFLAKQKLGW